MPRPEREVSVSLAIMVMESRPGQSWAEAACPKCRGPLDWLQPDPARPYRLLGVCEDCSAWVIAEVDQDTGEVMLAALPERLPDG